MSRAWSVRISFWLTVLLLVLLTAAVVFLPWILDEYIRLFGKDPAIRNGLAVTLYGASLPSYVLVGCLLKLLANLLKERVFIRQNVQLLHALSWCCLAISLVFFAGGFCYILLTLIACAAFFFWLILRVLANVFYHAGLLQEEADYTI